MNYEPLVSIIIPVYNGANYLSQAIESAIAQTYHNLEIIVVNDGSTDGGETEKIALSYGQKIKYYKKENGGVSTVLNFAFKKMNGEWFSWLSHDDLYYPEKIEKEIEFINQLVKEDPNINLEKITVRCSTESIDKYGRTIRVPSYIGVPKKEKPIDTILSNIEIYRLSGCAFLLPVKCIYDVGDFREDIRTVSDVEYWNRLLFNGYTFYFLDERLVKNRSHKSQVGKTKVTLFDKEIEELYIWIADELFKNEVYRTKDVYERLCLSLVSRKIFVAEKYAKKYLKQLTSPFYYLIIYHCKWVAKYLKGTLRLLARGIYRKVRVK